MEILNDFWYNIKLLFSVFWLLFTLFTIILSYEGNVLPLFVVNCINIILGIIIYKKN